MQIIRQLPALRERLKLLRAKGETIALVPTMGALHAGHLSLVEIAAREADHVIASIFVNPKQFAPGEDFDRYPRTEDQDAVALANAGVALLWMPPVEEVYPPGFATTVSVAGLGEGWCGADRPGHFDGVATVVAKLFNQVRPDVAVFGEKDWQQLAIIRRMARDLDFDGVIIGGPTVREADGLALSSRNRYLSPTDRQRAAVLPAALRAAADAIDDGRTIDVALAEAKAAILAGGFGAVDYLGAVDAATLEPLAMLDREGRLLAAARIGETRLIDNLPLVPKNRQPH